MPDSVPPTGKRYAILIASSRYPDEPRLTPLRCPENDVDSLNEVLRSPDFGQFTETFVFKNAPNQEVLERIETVLLNEAGKDDLVLVYFSGHGKLNAFGGLCLAMTDTKLRALGSTSIPAERLKVFFKQSSSRRKILILDCCYSGAVGKDFIRGGVDDQLQLMSGGQGTFIMTASTGIQVAVEKESDQLGLFTKHLVDGIKSGEADRNKDGLVDIHELYQHVYEKVREEGAQEPMKWGFQAKGTLIIAKSGRKLGTSAWPELTENDKKININTLSDQDGTIDDSVSQANSFIVLSGNEITIKDKELYLSNKQVFDNIESDLNTLSDNDKTTDDNVSQENNFIVLLDNQTAIEDKELCLSNKQFADNAEIEPNTLPDQDRTTGNIVSQENDFIALSENEATIENDESCLSNKQLADDIESEPNILSDQDRTIDDIVSQENNFTVSSENQLTSEETECCLTNKNLDSNILKKILVVPKLPPELSLRLKKLLFSIVVSYCIILYFFNSAITDTLFLNRLSFLYLRLKPILFIFTASFCIGLGCFFSAAPFLRQYIIFRQYIDNGDGTITDTTSGLRWKHCLEGLSGVNCENGEAERYTRNDAVQRFNHIEYAGYSDWRIPTINELKTLVHCSNGKNRANFCNDGSEEPTIDQQTFPNNDAYSVCAESPSTADDQVVFFYVGHSFDFYNGSSLSNCAIRLVRGGQ